MFCEHCGAKIQVDSLFCENCGTKQSLSDTIQFDASPAELSLKQPKLQNTMEFIRKNILFVAIVAVLSIAVIVLIFILFSGRDNSQSYVDDYDSPIVSYCDITQEQDESQNIDNNEPEDSGQDIWGQVTFDTPGHAGVNMREESNSSSTKLCVLNEGTLVKILEPYDESNNGYIKVLYNDYDIGIYYSGWILVEYLQFLQ